MKQQSTSNLRLIVCGLCCLFVAFLLIPAPDAELATVGKGGANARQLLAKNQRKQTYLRFMPTVINPMAIEMRTPCFHAEADEILRDVFENITKVVTRPNIFHEEATHPSARATLAAAKANLSAADRARYVHDYLRKPDDSWEDPVLNATFYEAIGAMIHIKTCPNIHVVVIALLFRLGRFDDAKEAVENALLFFPRHKQLSVLGGLIFEVYRNSTHARTLYLNAIASHPELSMNLFGVPADRIHKPDVHPGIIFRNQFGELTEDSDKIHLWAIQRLVLAWLFAEDYATGPSLTLEEARAWQKQWYFHVKGYLSPYTAAVTRELYRMLISNGLLRFKDPQAIRYTSYNDVTARFLLATHIGIPQRIVDFPLLATYTYMGGYVGSEKSELSPHTDRPQCEYTASVSVDISPADAECPLGLNPHVQARENKDLTGVVFRDPGAEDKQVYVHPRMGDALLFKGRHLVHWRKPIAPGVNCTNVFLHHVHAEFPDSLN